MNADPLAVVAEQRRRLAERARLPWWCWTALGAATVGVLVSQYVSVRFSETTGFWVVLLPSLLVFAGAGVAAGRLNGLVLVESSSTSLPNVVCTGALLVALLAVRMLAFVAPMASLVGVAVGTAGVLALMSWGQAVKRADIRAGRVRPT